MAEFPILLWDDGSGPKIVDGSHRQRLCDELGIAPCYVNVKGDEETIRSKYGWAANAARRSMTKSRRVSLFLAAHPQASVDAIVERCGVTRKLANNVARKVAQDPDTARRAADGEPIGDPVPEEPEPQPLTVNVPLATLCKIHRPVRLDLGYTSVGRFVAAVHTSIGHHCKDRTLKSVQLVTVDADGNEAVHTIGGK